MTDFKAIKTCSHSLSRYLYQDASVILILMDSKGTIIEANRYAREIINHDILGKNITDFLVDFSNSIALSDLIDQNDDAHMLNVTSSSGLPQTFYFKFLQHDENILAIGELNHVEVESLRKNLMSLNNEFSNLNRELHKKNAELVKLNDLKNHFLGMAAHDLRNPIGAIQNLSEFLLEEAASNLTSEHLKFISVINTSSRFMLSLLDQLLDIARIEAGKLDLDIQPTDLLNLIKTCVELNRVLADKKGIKIQFHHYEAFPEIKLDAMKIEQVMHNLLSNAIKFSQPGTRVYVSAFLSDDHVTVSVKDEGPGIPREDLDKLYKPFSRTSVQVPAGEKSTGLGLAIVHKIILGHSGKIWVDSKVGEGSVFSFSIPLKHSKTTRNPQQP
ncbi:PAS domain-containing sensor histidine kinase [Desulfonatronovibrio magnus]|uniref:PAS domain-containing sensor histidine kinase n=1 Tax=Desulfonatronovibrio magnus TaxID=698827 RepID=UPI0006987E4B|nr:PAS domain-containing sensor histidine kinase [Desulfonatronovibrio magnus]RQD66763.1 MAG: two-component sensor histidine kinase [Desulfonatronovibrio sp. MSAO_Bac4]